MNRHLLNSVRWFEAQGVAANAAATLAVGEVLAGELLALNMRLDELAKSDAPKTITYGDIDKLFQVFKDTYLHDNASRRPEPETNVQQTQDQSCERCA